MKYAGPKMVEHLPRAVTLRDTDGSVRLAAYSERQDNGCLLWLGHLDRKGYGTFSVGERTTFVHRQAWENANGPIPDGLVIDHLCRVRNCINPAHMETVLPAVNTLRGDSPGGKYARRTHCDNGHEYDEANTYRTPKGGRTCRTCQREAVARYKRRKADR